MISVCGAGSWGTALAIVLGRNQNNEVSFWGRDPVLMRRIQETRHNEVYLPGCQIPNSIVIQTELDQAIVSAKDILVAVPSHAFCSFLELIKPYLTPQHRLVWATKGLEPDTGRFFHEVVVSKLGGQQPYAILSGPSFAKEVGKELPTAVTVASNDEQFAEDLVAYFHCDVFRVYTSTDLIGVQLGGVVKNILAVATGISDGLGFGANTRAALITRGLSEMMRLGTKLGATVETMTGLTGVGDLLLTCTDDQSRNRRFGLALAKGLSQNDAQKEIGQVVEAVHNAAEILKLAKRYDVEVPIVQEVNNVLQNEVSPLAAVQNLMTRKPRVE